MEWRYVKYVYEGVLVTVFRKEIFISRSSYEELKGHSKVH